mmetsp:Transcript_7319/g.11142  ORF Transcript_7319/g.11142 Transcript_7319/m.11142 type:complete len:112 (-) Transcript_7319:907-1242(-)
MIIISLVHTYIHIPATFFTNPFLYMYINDLSLTAPLYDQNAFERHRYIRLLHGRELHASCKYLSHVEQDEASGNDSQKETNGVQFGSLNVPSTHHRMMKNIRSFEPSPPGA